MQNFLYALLICSATMAAVSVLFMLLSPLLSKRYGAKWQYYAWLVITIGFIIPQRPAFDFKVFTVSMLKILLSEDIQSNQLCVTYTPVLNKSAKTIFEKVQKVYKEQLGQKNMPGEEFNKYINMLADTGSCKIVDFTSYYDFLIKNMRPYAKFLEVEIEAVDDEKAYAALNGWVITVFDDVVVSSSKGLAEGESVWVIGK